MLHNLCCTAVQVVNSEFPSSDPTRTSAILLPMRSAWAHNMDTSNFYVCFLFLLGSRCLALPRVIPDFRRSTLLRLLRLLPILRSLHLAKKKDGANCLPTCGHDQSGTLPVFQVFLPTCGCDLKWDTVIRPPGQTVRPRLPTGSLEPWKLENCEIVERIR